MKSYQVSYDSGANELNSNVLFRYDFAHCTSIIIGIVLFIICN